MNSSLVINCVPLEWVICLSSVMLCNISLCIYFREVVGVNVGKFCACCIHCIASGVGRRGICVLCFLNGLHYLFLVGK